MVYVRTASHRTAFKLHRMCSLYSCCSVGQALTSSARYWVDFCADSNIDSGNCLNVCDQTRNGFGNTALTPCTGQADSDRWCCGGSNDCCTTNVGVVKLAEVFGGTISSSIVSSATSSATSRASSAASSAASATASSASASTTGGSATASPAPSSGSSEKKSSLSGGAIAGIVIGAIAGLALVAAAIFFARRAAMYKKRAAAPSSNYVEAPANPPQYPDQGYVGPGSEKYAQQNQHRSQGLAHYAPPTELPPAPPSELPASVYAQSAPPLPRK